jgi:xanthine/CO dehydrogenase XdhC/CoxF family maturation factor
VPGPGLTSCNCEGRISTHGGHPAGGSEPHPTIIAVMNQEVFSALTEALQQGDEVALVTIVSSTGSTPQRVGAKMLVYADGRTVGTIGGGCYENDAFWKAREAIKARRPLTVKYELNDDFAQETGLVCGGQMDVFIEPVEPRPTCTSSAPATSAPPGAGWRTRWASASTSSTTARSSRAPSASPRAST